MSHVTILIFAPSTTVSLIPKTKDGREFVCKIGQGIAIPPDRSPERNRAPWK